MFGARKFAPYIVVPGVPRGDLKITGEISLTDWETIIQELQTIEEAEASAKPQVLGEAMKSSTKKEPNQFGEDADVGQSDDNRDTVASTFQPSEPTDAEGPDDDEEENQLE